MAMSGSLRQRRSALTLPTCFRRLAWRPPPGDRLRGPHYHWLFFAAGPVEAAWSNKAMGFVVPQGRERMMGYGRFEDVVNVSSSMGDGSAPVRRRCVRGISMTH
jgi:hypothetical protein